MRANEFVEAATQRLDAKCWAGKHKAGTKIKGGVRVNNCVDEASTYQPPTITVGDEVRVGKFKNRKAEVKGFTKDKNNQPVLKTNKGNQQLFKPRITKLMKANEFTGDNVMAPWGASGSKFHQMEDIEQSLYAKLSDEFPNLKTLLYFVPGLAPVLAVADAVSAIDIYNKAIDDIERKYPTQTIQAAQEKVGDDVAVPLSSISPEDIQSIISTSQIQQLRPV